MSDYHRLFVERKPGWDTEAQDLLKELRSALRIENLDSLRIIWCYEIAGLSLDELIDAAPGLLYEKPRDRLLRELPAGKTSIPREYLPGQFDQRADSASRGLQLLHPEAAITVNRSDIFILDGSLTEADLLRIRCWLINPVESREKDLDSFSLGESAAVPEDVPVLAGYRQLDETSLGELRKKYGVALGTEDLEFIRTWFARTEKRDPTLAELRALAAHRAGVRTIMITGDHPATAQRIAADLGIAAEGGRAATGLELERLDDAGLADVVRTTSVYARVAPQHKLRIVDALQGDGHVVAMTGDGVNDAPALKSADIGIAMGITGTEVTKEASRMILADDNFATIVAAIHRGRIIFDNIAKFLRYMMSSNLGEVFTVFFGIVLAGVIGLRDASSPGGLVVPLLATQILWINLVTDSVPGLAMGVDPEIDDVMARRPRRPDRPILDRRMWARILFTGTAMGAVTLATMDLSLPGGLLSSPFGAESFDTARTAGFTTLVLAQLFNALSSRSATQSAFHRMFRNPWLWSAIGLVVALQLAVVHLPFLQAAFTTEPLTLEQWLFCVGMASVVLWAQEVIKLVERWVSREPTPA